MKNVIWVRITKSLCAVFLIFSLLLCTYPCAVWAAEETSETEDLAQQSGEELPETDTYRYLLEIVYSGTFTFTYDWGVWDPEECRYVASQDSKNPAADTTDGMPGWYGFDGVTNKISFINRSLDNSLNIYVRLDYHTEDWVENGETNSFPDMQQPITIAYYENWTAPAEGETLPNNGFSNPYTDYLDPDVYGAKGCVIEIPPHQQTDDSTDVYFTLSGEPVLNSGEMYHSPSPSAIGFIKITVGTERDDLKPKS